MQPPHYVELLGIVPAADTPIAAWLAARLADRGDHFAAWAVRTDDLDAEGRWLARTPQDGGGATLRWRTVRPSAADAEHLPFFIEYDGESATRYLRERVERASSPARPGGFAWLEVATDPSALAAWLGPNELPIRVVSGRRGVRAVGIDSPHGVIELRIG